MQINIKTILYLFLILLTNSICLKLPIQAHSFNDLNYLSNLIKKGIDYFKIDVSLANKKSCIDHSTWNQSQLCIKHSKIVEEVCCHSLRGDTSSMLSYSYPFNTS
jgi:hypothetical protein